MKYFLKRATLLLMACALQVHPAFALLVDESPVPATGGGYDNSGGSFSGFAGFADQTLETVRVTGSRCSAGWTCYSTFTWYTTPPSYLIIGSGGGGGDAAVGPSSAASSPDEIQKAKETCLKNCDTDQTMAKDLCDYTYSQMAASAEGLSAITGVSFLIYGITKYGMLGGLATGGAAYSGASMAGDKAATAYLRGCNGQSSLAHYNCYREKCHA